MKSDSQIREEAFKREARVDTRHISVAVSGHLPSSTATSTIPSWQCPQADTPCLQGRNPRFTEMRAEP
jgi:hypothetical protein